MGNPRCRWGSILSTTHKKAPPRRKPVTAGNQGGMSLPPDISIAGARSDQ